MSAAGGGTTGRSGGGAAVTDDGRIGSPFWVAEGRSALAAEAVSMEAEVWWLMEVCWGDATDAGEGADGGDDGGGASQIGVVMGGGEEGATAGGER